MKGSGVTSVSLPDGGSLETIYYPSSITNITLKNLTNLATVNTDTLYNLSTLIVDNCPKIQGATGKENYNSKLWDLLQGTEPSPLSSINVEAYGSIKTNSGSFFFPDKYYNYDTAKNIKGEIEYLGTTVPKNYTKFVDSYPKLKITYPNINDASEMFANYKNLNCISSLSAFAGRDIYGNSKYVTIYYWTDETNELKTKWHTTENYEKYGNSKTYSEGIGYYVFNDVCYRLLSVHDDADLDILRAEIKSHVSNFSKFIKLNGMFKNMSVLDYLDPDTFNNVDISEATTDEMFYGCTGLQYFETPTDVVKNEILTVYLDDKGNEIEDTTGMDLTQLQTKEYYVNPFNRSIRLDFTDENKTSLYAKGMRTFGENMFYNCKKTKIYIKKLLVKKTLDKYNRISIAENAFKYDCYDPSKDSQSSNITIERPVILFEHKPYEILNLTIEAISVDQFGNNINNPVCENDSSKYYSLNEYKDRELNFNNDYILFVSNKWLREVYFDITKFIIKEDLSVFNLDSKDTQLPINSNVYIAYAENSTGGRVLFKLYDNNTLTTFNRFNGLNLISECISSLPLSASNFNALTTLGFKVQEYDCLDTTLPRFAIENTVFPIFATTDTITNFSIDSGRVSFGSNLKNLSITNSEEIPENYFRGFNPESIYTMSYGKELKRISNFAFYRSSKLSLFRIEYLENNKIYMAEDIGEEIANTKSIINYIGEQAFADCSKLSKIYLPDTIIELGTEIFNSCKMLKNVRYPLNITYIPENCFRNCDILQALYNTSNIFAANKLKEIRNGAFSGCSALSSFINVSKKEIILYKLTSLTTIGDNAFMNCSRFMNNFKFHINPSLTYIGSSAFEMSLTHAPSAFINFEWETGTTENPNPYQNLDIGSRAFSMLYPQINFTTVMEDNPSLFVPKVAYIGIGAFSVYDSSKPYTYCLMENSEEEIGKNWVNYTNKIIYNYFGTVESNEGQGVTATYILSQKDDRREAYLHHVIGTASSFEFRKSINYNENEFILTQVLQNAFDTLTNGDSTGNTISTFLFDYESQLELIEAGIIINPLSIQMAISKSGNDKTFVNNILPSKLRILSGNRFIGTEWYNNIKQSLTTPYGSYITLGNEIIGYKPLESEVNPDSGTATGRCKLNLTSASRKINILIDDPNNIGKKKIDKTYIYINGELIDNNGNKLTLNDGDIFTINTQEYQYSLSDNKFYLKGTTIALEMENYLKNCNIIYDSALSASSINSNITEITFPNDRSEYYIYSDAFSGQVELSKITLPKNIKTIGSNAFYNCSIEELFLPNTITEIGVDAFKTSNETFGVLKFVDIEDGAKINGNPFGLNGEEIRYNTSSGTESGNITFKSIHIPTSMSDLFTTYSELLRKATQMRNIYLGKLKLNDTIGNKNYGTIWCKNYPLYKDKNGNATFDETSEKFVDNNGNPLYVPAFYHDICIKENIYTNDTNLRTTEEYGVIPLGDYEDENGKLVQGFAQDIDLRYIRTYNTLNITPIDKDKFNTMLNNGEYASISAEELLRILAAYTRTGDRIYNITLPADTATLTLEQQYLFMSKYGGKYKITRLVDVSN